MTTARAPIATPPGTTSDMEFRVAVFQGPCKSEVVAERVDRLAVAVRDAATLGVRLLIFPELFLTGYNIGREAIVELAEPSDGPWARRIATIAGDAGVAVLYGYPERAGSAIYNAAQLIGRDGRRIANHRKTHLFGEVDRAVFSAGDLPVTIAEIDGLSIGVLICYEVEFPENARMLALAGAELIAVPTALMEPYRFVAQTLIRARAFENQVFLAYANHCGEEGEFRYTGLSGIIAPDGSELVRAGSDEALLVATLDSTLRDTSRRINPYLSDRRAELYAPIADLPH